MTTEGKQMRVLVTGGTGYVGSVLVPLLASQPETKVRVYCSQTFGNSIDGTPGVEFIQGDVRDEVLLRASLKGITDVVHLAGIVTDELVDLNPALARHINVEATASLCRLCVEARVDRLVYASSSSVYGAVDHDATEMDEPHPMSAYAEMKLEGERVIEDNKGPMTCCYVRSATACGPAPRMRLDTIVNIFSKQAWFDWKITVWGGDQWRSNVHVKDVASFYALMLKERERRIAGQAFNVTCCNHTALELADMVQNVAGQWRRKASICCDASRRDSRHYRLDASKAWKQLGWVARHTIRNAINDNFAWFQAGHIVDPNSDLYVNTRRMAPLMTGTGLEGSR